jgi:hypothetical protein
MRLRSASRARVAAWGALASDPLTNCRLVHWVASLAVLLSLLLAGGGQPSRAQTDEEEYRVKAAFIFHFAQLVDWPPDTQIDTEN